MGLASALSTSLTGLTAAEATIDVVGNNVANSNTVGFKSSEVQFATQFSQTQSLGSAPTTNSGGTNPRQIGLGVSVSEITPNFTQGTLQVSNSPSDLAIQGDGFFIAEGGAGQDLYTRNGVFKTNSANELVTTTGLRLLGFGVNSSFQVQNTTLVPITIPFGAAAVAQATSNVVLGGTLTPTGTVATTPEIIQSEVLTDGSIEVPGSTTTTIGLNPPSVVGTTVAPSAAAGAVPAGTYLYKMVYLSAGGLEGPPSAALPAITTTGTAGVDQTVSLGALPLPPAGFVSTNIYRSDNGGAFQLVGNTAGAAFNDGSAAGGAALNGNVLPAGSFSYYVTFFDSQNNTESRPTALIGPQTVSANGRIELNNIPVPSVGSTFDKVNIYRNSLNDPGTFHLLTPVSLAAGTTDYIDGASDASIAANATVNLDGPPITFKTAMADVVTRNGTNYIHVFNPNYDPNQPLNGFLPTTLDFTGQKGADGTNLTTKTFAFDNTTTVQSFMQFVQQATGIQDSSADTINPIPGQPGGSIVNSRMQFVSNIGTENAVAIGVSALDLTAGGITSGLNMNFNETQKANGESAKVDMLVYNSLGEKLNVRVTAVMEQQTGVGTTWRWFADSGDNSPTTGAAIAVGTGEFTFDANGHYQSGTNSRISIDLSLGTNTLPITMDFSQISGLAAKTSTLFVTKTDGSAPGTLSSFVVAENGLISGLFSNGVSRNLGQIRLARFANNDGLEQRGQNMFASGVNSGVPIEANPGDQGLGTLIAGAVEQSNTDVGQNLIQLITASTQYRGGARVITTVQQLLDELMNLRR